MDKNIFLSAVFILCLISTPGPEKAGSQNLVNRRAIYCGPENYYTLSDLPRIKHPRLIYPDDPSDFPKVIANDNVVPAGNLANNVLELNLEIEMSDFYFETDRRPGLRLVAIAEKGKAPSIPAPLIRIETGTKIHVVLHNTLTDSTATVYGLQKRPSSIPDSIVLKPGETKDISFESGCEGTYMYWIKLGNPEHVEFGPEEEQLSGAFIIDPKGGSPPDRVFVMNVFSTPIDSSLFINGSLEALTINGKSWPFTERIEPSVGETIRWRVINSSNRLHPMHLHGFNYSVLSKGSVLTDHIYKKGRQPVVVTESMTGQTTMSMKWVASRPGNWLFHCHLSFHVTADIRLPGAASLDPPDQSQHMAGLVTGIIIKPGASDLISKGKEKRVDLYAHEYSSGKLPRNGFSLLPGFIPGDNLLSSPGPLLLLKQYQPTYITVINQMPIPTSIHWHGLEIDSWADGVPDWSASDGKTSPSIQPGEKFTYKLTLMRPGSFIYHTHLDDINQLTSGLYGPLIVLGENETYNPTIDHFYIVGWKNPDPLTLEELELNGSLEQPLQNAHTGEKHRLRLMNIAPAGRIKISMLKNGKPVMIKFIAKDGIDMPSAQQINLEESPFFGAGETADFVFNPLKPGIYSLQVETNVVEETWKQQWIVTDKFK